MKRKLYGTFCIVYNNADDSQIFCYFQWNLTFPVISVVWISMENACQRQKKFEDVV